MSDMTIYVNDNCPGCTVVMNYVESNQINCNIVNVDFDRVQPPDHLLVFPALFRTGRLLAYGEDIIRHLSRQ